MTSFNMSNENISTHLQISQLNTLVFRTTLIPSFIYICMLLVIGIPGNALVCFIYQFKIRNRSLSSNIFILALSWFDLINCLVSLPIEIKFILNFVQFDEPIICKLSRFLTFFCNNASATILMAIAVDRLVAFLSGPVRRRLKPKITKGIVVMAMVIAGSVSWPMLFFFGTYTLPLSNGVVIKSCTITNTYINSQPVIIFTIVLLSLHILFDLALFGIYSVIGKRICYDINMINLRQENTSQSNSVKLQFRKHSDSSNEEAYITRDHEIPKSRSTSPCRMKINFVSQESRSSTKLLLGNQDSLELSQITTSTEDDYCNNESKTTRNNNKTNAKQSKHRQSPSASECKIFNRHGTASRTSFMLFIVTMAYVISFMPYCVIVLVRQVSQATFYERQSNTEKAIYQLFLRSYALSSAINPIIYSLMNPSFRKKCKHAISEVIHSLGSKEKS